MSQVATSGEIIITCEVPRDSVLVPVLFELMWMVPE
jgi:hypothetical protein